MADGPLYYALAWLSFGAVHTFFAGGRLKAVAGGYARLLYNGIALGHILLVTYLGKGWLSTVPFSPAYQWGGLAVTALGVVFMTLSLRSYDLGLLAGTKQLRLARQGLPPEDEQSLTTTGPHRYVRHPLYSSGFVILWGLASSDYGLATAIWGSAYLLAGTWFEERRLAKRFGDAYLRYQRQVPAFVPWRGRVALQ